MTMFSSRTAESFDPEPYYQPQTRRRVPFIVDSETRYDPRPHFEPTRDPNETHWLDPMSGVRMTDPDGKVNGRSLAWQPRPEYARPEPNPILVGIREGDNSVEGALDMLHEDAREWWTPVVSDAHIIHARRVLTLLAALND